MTINLALIKLRFLKANKISSFMRIMSNKTHKRIKKMKKVLMIIRKKKSNNKVGTLILLIVTLTTLTYKVILKMN